MSTMNTYGPSGIKNPLSGPGGAAGAGSADAGYHGLAGVLSFLQNGVNANQYQRLSQGYDGLDGAVGGAHGAFSGLSPYAVQFLAQSGLLTQDPAQHVSTTAPDTVNADGTTTPGAALTGSQLFMANLLNGLYAQQPRGYHLQQGIGQSDLASALAAFSGGGHSAYNKGYDASGKVLPPPAPPAGHQARQGGSGRHTVRMP